MVDAAAGAGELKAPLAYYASRPSAAFDEVVLKADYCTRAMLSFYRFRRLGGANEKKGQEIKVDERLYRGVHYVTDHPPVRIFNLSLIALIVLFESAANAYFFGLQSEFGLLGGLFQAAAVSLANVAVAYFIIGFWGLRHVSAPWGYHTPKKVFGIFAIVLGVVLVLAVNLSAAHYRNILDIQADKLALPEGGIAWTFIPGAGEGCKAALGSDVAKELSGAALNALCRPLSLHSLDAIVLLALGIAVAAIAALEGRRSDVAFPGLSDAARALERAREDLRDALADYADAYDDVVEEIKKTLAEDKAEFSVTAQDRAALYAALDARVERYRNLLTTPLQQLIDEFAVPKEMLAGFGLPGAGFGQRDALHTEPKGAGDAA